MPGIKVLHLSTSDIQGGAARAAYRLHTGLNVLNELKECEIESAMLVQAKSSADRRVFAPTQRSRQILTSTRIIWESLPLKAYPQCRQDGNFYPQWLPERVAGQVKKIQSDILNLHWISGGFIRIETLAKFRQPLVWTLHDMWAFTGGCHYSGACERYTQTCGSCPQLFSNNPRDLSNWVWRRKLKAWAGLNLTLICPTLWLATAARQSGLFQTHFQNIPIEVIPNGLDLQTFRPIDQMLARSLLHLSPTSQLVLFGALQATSDPRKGFDLLQSALLRLRQSELARPIEIVIFGAPRPEQPPDLGFPVHYLGQLQDELSLALAYSAADVMIVPSRQENLAQTACEALACGTPVVAFAQTGLADVVSHECNGYLAQPANVESLAEGITWVLADPERLQLLSRQARQRAEQQLGLAQMARAYATLYERILAEGGEVR